MSIPFTQFLLPFGQRKQIEIDRPPAIEDMARMLINQGVRFEVEVLRTGQVSLEALTALDEVLAGAICPNGPAVEEAVDNLVQKAHKEYAELE